MSNRVVVQIAGQEFTMLVDGNEQYVHKAAAHVDQKISKIIDETHMSMMNAAVLACMNITDEYFNAVEQAENLRRQLKEYVEESSSINNELAELKKENARLKKESK